MKRMFLGLVVLGALVASASANCHLDGQKVVCNGKKIGSIWCGFTGCKGYCEYRVYGEVKTYGTKEKAAQSVVNECKH